ncbi:MAG: hydantoinase B/oxoprolinase family protein [Arenicellales bacterium]|nr:hydantoinase B/oxoprolinase family protein [Arenicellales bacterium]
MPDNKLDPIKLEILWNGLRSITDEMFVALTRSAYSTNIKERRDHSTAIMDRAGRLVVQASQALPIHIASMSGLMACLLTKFGGDIQEGDIFVANDPHTAGGTHLPDVNMARPIFVGGELIGFVCNIAHHADIGGIAPGSMAGGMSEIYQEGLRIPVIRLFRKGVLQQDIMDLLLLNVRIPLERRGDYFAQIAACKLGSQRLMDIVGHYGKPFLLAAFDQIITRTEQRLRRAIAEAPDGVYEFEDVMDSDGIETFDIPICLTLTIDNDTVHFNFGGTAKQTPGNINVTMNATQASACYALKALLDPDVPNNEGILKVVDIAAPEGTLLNASFPAPVAARAHTCQRIVDVVFGALSKAFPDRVVAAANGANTTAVFAGTDPRTGSGYLYLETLGGGFGGRPTKDGRDGVQVHITNTSNLPVEAIEMEYPLLVEEYSLVQDSGGAGEFRGGMGLRRTVRPINHQCTFNGVGERFRHRPWGLRGGQPGAAGQFLIRDSSGRTHRLDDKPGEVRVMEDQAIIVETPGAGGYGSPKKRTQDRIDQDLQSGKFSQHYVEAQYNQQT